MPPWAYAAIGATFAQNPSRARIQLLPCNASAQGVSAWTFRNTIPKVSTTKRSRRALGLGPARFARPKAHRTADGGHHSPTEGRGKCVHAHGHHVQRLQRRQGTEKIFPFDLLPRVVEAKEWDWIERGLKQRITALNLFIDDIYHNQRILKEGIIPEHVVLSAASFRKACIGLNPPRGIWCHITGTDLVRDGDGQIYVLEDNLRCPSGVSYVLENREVMKRTFPQGFRTGASAAGRSLSEPTFGRAPLLVARRDQPPESRAALARDL